MNNNSLKLLTLCGLSTAITILFGCENTVNFKNAAPAGLTLTPSKCYVATGGTVRLAGGATDDDGDSLTYYWSAPAGTFAAVTSNASQVDWTAPASAGAVAITMTVSDQIAAKSLRKTITVCELLPSVIMVSRSIANVGHFYITSGAAPMRIPGNVAVAVDPGVTIVIDKPFGGIEVYGQLVAEGTATQKIKFVGNSCGSENGLYDGIYFVQSESQGALRYCDVSGGKAGVTAKDGGTATLRNCQIFGHTEYGVSSQGGSSVEVTQCNVWENGAGIYVLDGSAAIRRTSVRYNGADGIVCNQTEDDSTYVVTIDSCVVANNYFDGIELGERSAPAIHYCSIFANDDANQGNFALRLVANISPEPIHAENNYWGLGTDTEEEIAAIILDANDPYTGILAVVSFTPWLSQAPVARAAGVAGGAWGR